MDWVRDFYTTKSRAFARAAVTDAHRRIAGHVAAHAGSTDDARILELGAGNGGVARALADLGFDVTAVEFNPHDAALARELAADCERGSVDVVEADFYQVALDRRFDLVFYWDGFGVGDDADQRRLLRRIADDWLAPGGRVLLDVFSPWNWAARHGERHRYHDTSGAEWERSIAFDAVRCRYVDAWRSPPGSGPTWMQSLRCYSPPDLALLSAGTGLEIEAFLDMAGEPFALDSTSAATAEEQRTANGYLALLRAAQPSRAT